MTISPVVTQYYLQLKTNVPVPKLYGILGDIAVMKRVPGEPLAKAWASMPLSSKGEVVKQLANIQARLLRIRLRTIGRFQWDPSLFASQPQTPRFKVGTGICSDLGPQKSIGGLFKTLIGSLSEKLNENNRTKALLSRVRSRVASIVNDKNCNHKRKGLALEHDDLDPRNIMVDKDHVTGILDWDGATVIPRELASPGLPWLQGTYGMSEAEEREIATLFNIYETTLERAGEGEKALKLREATRYDAPPGLSDLWVLLSIEKTFGWAELLVSEGKGTVFFAV
ncbi:uncharacterized protein EV422DRAFT_506109 [Fimicolochytrium jonesii]|uniref:uncharacterized protein n=1 Tax=Fimicolochytrium jonesii TaxID=1396493 RepID=UPI0022FF1CCF|nr:uncharacterized protein EV422DRAFT_506109 [Fimicolochytrium jonesii]KAI8821439.1 hypothetical protein EV422DRAFT_506109 [Fimicolochytrium jonesii]